MVLYRNKTEEELFKQWVKAMENTMHIYPQFDKQNKNQMKNKFPISIEPADAQQIIDTINRTRTKNNLAAKWGMFIVLGENIEIYEDLYLYLRAIPNSKLNNLLDELFEKDEVEIDFSILNEFDIFYVKNPNGTGCLCRGGSLFENNEKKCQILSLKTGYYGYTYTLCDKKDVKEFRLATYEEQILFFKAFPIKIKPGQIWKYRDTVSHRIQEVVVIKISEKGYIIADKHGKKVIGCNEYDLMEKPDKKELKNFLTNPNFILSEETLENKLK